MSEALMKNQTQQVQTWLDPSIVVSQIKKIQQIYKGVMKANVHYGPAFPGSDKPTLLQPGGELLSLIFRLDLQHDVQIDDLGSGHREYTVKTTVHNIVTGERLGSGVGSASTKESKYRYRKGQPTCPQCGAETIFRDKSGNGWYCWAKKGGCGAKFKPNDIAPVGKVENPDIADVYNTVLKIAKKRSAMDAIKSVTGASAFFTQDAEDFIDAKFEGISEPQHQPEPEPEPEPDLQPAHDAISALLDEYKVHPKAVENSLQKHLGVGVLEDCKDINKLRAYYRYKKTQLETPTEPTTDAQNPRSASTKEALHQKREELDVWQDVVQQHLPDKLKAFEAARAAADWQTCEDIYGEAFDLATQGRDEEDVDSQLFPEPTLPEQYR